MKAVRGRRDLPRRPCVGWPPIAAAAAAAAAVVGEHRPRCNLLSLFISSNIADDEIHPVITITLNNPITLCRYYVQLSTTLCEQLRTRCAAYTTLCEQLRTVVYNAVRTITYSCIQRCANNYVQLYTTMCEQLRTVVYNAVRTITYNCWLRHAYFLRLLRYVLQGQDVVRRYCNCQYYVAISRVVFQEHQVPRH